MSGFATALVAIYDFMQIHWNLGGYQISFWELVVYSVLASLLWFFIRQFLDIDD